MGALVEDYQAQEKAMTEEYTPIARERAWHGYCELVSAEYDFSEVHLEKLDMGSPCLCMLGQGFGGYGFSEGLATLAKDLGVDIEGDDDAAERFAEYNGFDLPAHDTVNRTAYYAALDEAWRELVTQHRALGEAVGW